MAKKIQNEEVYVKSGNSTRSRWMAIALLGAGALLAGCASDGGNSGGGDSSGGENGTVGSATANGGGAYEVGMVNVQPDAGQPQSGGTLTYGVQLLTPSLDPAKTAARDDAGGALAAVYDVLISYDPDNETFEPKLAKSLDTKDGGVTWTLGLRDGVTFSDGTALDADAVVASINRYNAGRGSGSDLWQKTVESMTATDASTVEFRLNAQWQRFPSMLSLGHGMIVAAAADKGETFAAIGAGPFTDAKFSPNEERVYKANPSYYGGPVKLDQLRLVPLNGPQANFESLESGQLDIGYIRGSGSVINAAKDKGYPGYINVLNVGSAELINNRDGRPGADVRVRQAIAHALDPVLINQRAENGEGLPGSEVFGPESRWHTDTPGVEYDPAKATELLAAAKADGYDGKLSYVVLNEPKDQAGGLAVQSLLQAVGFDVEIVMASNVVDLIQNVYIKHDFDLAHSGLGLYEAIPDLGLYSTLQSDSISNLSGYVNPEMDQLILELREARDDAAAKKVLAKVQVLWNETVPSAPIGGLPSFWAWQKNTHDIVPTAAGIMLFDQAWKAAN